MTTSGNIKTDQNNIYVRDRSQNMYDQSIRVTMEKINEHQKCKKSHVNPYTSILKDIL